MRRLGWAIALLILSHSLLPVQSASAANANVTLPATFSIAPNSSNVSLGLGGSVIGGGLSGTIVVAIKLKNAIFGEFLKQPVTSGLTITDAYGGSTSSGFYSIIETGTVADVNSALNAMTITTPSNVGAPELWITAGAYDSAWKYFTNTHHFYFVGTTARSYTNADLESKGKSYLGFTGYLATVTSAAENTFVNGLTSSSFWLGGTDYTTAGIWKWDPSGGSPEAGTTFYLESPATSIGFTNWNSGEPNGGTGEYDLQVSTSDVWNDLNDSGNLLIAMTEVGGNGGDIFGTTAGANVSTMSISASSGSSIIYGLTSQSFFSNGTTSPSTTQPLQPCGTVVYQQPQINYNYGASGLGGPNSTNTAGGAISSYTGDTCYVAESWITRWQGYLSVPSIATSVKFQAISDDGESLTVNSTQVLNYWADGQGTKASGAVSGINKNSYYSIDVWFYEYSGGASMSLSWDLGDGNGFVLIPTWALTTTVPTQTAMSYSVGGGSTATYRLNNIITETSTVGGKVTFSVQGKPLPGCKGVNTTFTVATGIYNATCTWKPSIHKPVNVKVSLAPYGGQFNSATSANDVLVIARSGKR
jgi:hypothetical protein